MSASGPQARTLKLLCLAIMAAPWTLPAGAAEVYQCLAADGSKSYSDAPCGPAAKSVTVPVTQRARRSTGGPDILRASYISPRNGRVLDVRMQLQSACDQSAPVCAVQCGNQLAGDPDFGQRKYCQIRYQCSDDSTHELQIVEGESSHLSCPAPPEAARAAAAEQQSPPETIAASPPGAPSALAGPLAGPAAASVVSSATTPAASATAAGYRPQTPPPNGQSPSSPAFSDYVLSLYWRPTLCSDHPQADQCRGIGQEGFVLNGLWPHKDFASPVHCAVNLPISDAVVQSMADLLPTRALVEHEWSEHGSCTGMDPRQYFQTVRHAYDSMVLPDLSYKGAPLQQRLYDMGRYFQGRDHGLSPLSLAITCTNENPPRLQEVRVCLTQELYSRYCSGDIIMSRCQSVSVQVPPAH